MGKKVLAAALGLVFLFFALLFLVAELGPVTELPEAELLAIAQEEFLEHDLYEGDLMYLEKTMADVLAEIKKGERLCGLDPPGVAPEGMKSVTCSVTGKNGRRRGVEYYLTPGGTIDEKFLFDENTELLLQRKVMVG